MSKDLINNQTMLKSMKQDKKNKMQKIMDEMGRLNEDTPRNRISVLQKNIIADENDSKEIIVYYNAKVYMLCIDELGMRMKSCVDETDCNVVNTTVSGGGYPTIRLYGKAIPVHELVYFIFHEVDAAECELKINHMVVALKQVSCGNSTIGYELRGIPEVDGMATCLEAVSNADNNRHGRIVLKYGLFYLMVSVKDIAYIEESEGIQALETIFADINVKTALETLYSILPEMKTSDYTTLFGNKKTISYKAWVNWKGAQLYERVKNNKFLREVDRNSIYTAYDIIDKAFKERIDKNAEAFLSLKKDSPDRVDYREYRKDA